MTVDVFHILEKGDERVLFSCRRNNTSLSQHVLLAARLEFHLVHEVLNASLVEDAVGVDEEHEQVVVSLEILGVNLVDELEGPLLAVTLIDRLGVCVERKRDAELLDGVQVKLVFLVSVEGEEDVQTGRWVFTVYQRVAGSEKNLGNFLVARHDNDDLGSG